MTFIKTLFSLPQDTSMVKTTLAVGFYLYIGGFVGSVVFNRLSWIYKAKPFISEITDKQIEDLENDQYFIEALVWPRTMYRNVRDFIQKKKNQKACSSGSLNL